MLNSTASMYFACLTLLCFVSEMTYDVSSGTLNYTLLDCLLCAMHSDVLPTVYCYVCYASFLLKFGVCFIIYY